MLKSSLPKSRKSMSIATTFLVLATVVLVTTSLLVFVLREKNKETMRIFDIQELYFKEDLLNFYIQNIMDKTCEEYAEAPVDIEALSEILSKNSPEMKDRESTAVFIALFKKELNKHKVGDKFFPEELSQVEPQVNEKNLQKKDREFNLTLKIKLNKHFYEKSEDGKKILSVNYTYVKSFKCSL